MKIHFFDDDGYLCGEGAAEPGDVPGSWVFPLNATPEPPPEAEPGGTARWDGLRWEAVAAPSVMELREAAYRREADPLFRQAQYYWAESRGLRSRGEHEAAAKFEDIAVEKEKRYAAVKAAIRARYPEAAAVQPVVPPSLPESPPAL